MGYSPLYGQPVYGGTPYAGTTYFDSPTNQTFDGASSGYIIDVADVDLNILARLDKWQSATFSYNANQASTYTLSYPASESKAQYLSSGEWVGLNWIEPNWLIFRDSSGSMIDIAKIIKTSSSLSQNGDELINVTATDLIGQLAEDTTGQGFDTRDTFKNFVINFLSFQGAGKPNVTANDISFLAGMGTHYQPSGTAKHTILHALRTVQEITGGIFFTDPDTRYFHWIRNRSNGEFIDIRVGGNMLSLLVNEDSSQIRNSVEAEGTLPDGTEITSSYTVAGADELRILRPAIKQVDDQEALDRFAILTARKQSRPVKTLTCSALQVSTNPDTPRILPGWRVRIVDPITGDTINAMITSVAGDFANPSVLQLGFGSLTGKGMTIGRNPQLDEDDQQTGTFLTLTAVEDFEDYTDDFDDLSPNWPSWTGGDSGINPFGENPDTFDWLSDPDSTPGLGGDGGGGGGGVFDPTAPENINSSTGASAVGTKETIVRADHIHGSNFREIGGKGYWVISEIQYGVTHLD